MPWGVLALATNGAVAVLNPAAEALWGVPAAAVLGHQPAQVQPAVLPLEFVKALAEITPAAGPYWLPHTQRWVSLHTASGSEGRRWVYWDDVTARQQAAHQQLAEQQQTRELLAAVEAVDYTGSYEADLATMDLQFSDGLYRLFGEAPKSFVPSFAFIDSRSHPDDVRVGQSLLAHALKSQEPYRYLHRIYLADGRQRTLEVHANVLLDPTGRPFKLLGLVQDVTARQQAEAANLRSQQALAQQATNQYRALFLALDQGYFLAEVEFDAQQRAIDVLYLDANPAAARMVGQDFTGQRLRDMNPTAGPYWYEIFGRVSLTGVSERLEYYAEPSQKWYDIYVFRPGDEASRRVAVVFQDVTARKRREAHTAFLASVQDDLSRLSTPDEILQAVGTRLGEHLQLDTCAFVDIDATQEYDLTLSYIWRQEEVPQWQRLFHSSDFLKEEIILASQAGQPTIVHDTQADGRVVAQAYAGMGIGAFVAFPFRRHGKWKYSMTMTAPAARDWQPDELELLGEVVQRVFPRLERARAEVALRHSETRFRSLFESMNQGFAVCELVRDQNGRAIDYQMLDINPAGERLTGISRADFIGNRVRELMPGVGMWWVETFARVVETGETTRFEHYVEPLNRWRDFTAFAYDGDQFAIIYDDITARKQIEQAEATTKAWLEEEVENRTRALQASHTRLNTIFEAVPLQLGYYEAMRDDTGQLVDLRVVAVNRASSDTMALPGVFPGMCMSAQLPGLQELPVWQAISEVIDTGQPQRLELRHEFDGRTVWFDVLYTRLEDGLISASLEITARKLMEQELREKQALLQSLFDTSLISMSLLQAVRDEAGVIQDFRIAIANKELERETGRTNLVGKLYTQECPVTKQVGIYDVMLRVMETGQPAGLEYYYKYEGADKWFACQFVKADDGLVATNLDITERKLAELEQAKAYQLLRQSEEVAGLGSWDYNLTTGEFLWSEGMYTLFGRAPGSAVQPAIYLEVAVPEDRAVAQRIVQGITAGRTGFEETLRIQVNGTMRTMHVKAAGAFDSAGEPVRMLGVNLDISKVQRLEDENLRLRLTQQQALFQAVLEAQETERRRMAESLHNGLGQTLYAVKLQLNQLPASPHSATLAQADRLLAEAIRQTRTLSHELVPTVLSEFGLSAALRDICRSLGSPNLRFACAIELDNRQPLPQSLQVALFRMAQELAQNVVKHARATEASLSLETVPGYVLLRVEDNGAGFAKLPIAASSGIGLRAIRDQVALLGGTVDVGSSPTFGTYVRLRIPLRTPVSLPA